MEWVILQWIYWMIVYWMCWLVAYHVAEWEYLLQLHDGVTDCKRTRDGLAYVGKIAGDGSGDVICEAWNTFGDKNRQKMVNFLFRQELFYIEDDKFPNDGNSSTNAINYCRNPKNPVPPNYGQYHPDGPWCLIQNRTATQEQYLFQSCEGFLPLCGEHLPPSLWHFSFTSIVYIC